MLNKKVFFFISLFLFILSAIAPSEIEDYRFSLSLYKDGYLTQAESAFKDFIVAYPKSIYKKKVIYLLSLSELKLKKYESAFNNLTSLANDSAFKNYNYVVYYYSLLASRLKKYKISEKYIKKYFSISSDQTDTKKKDKLAYISVVNNLSLGKKEVAINKALSYINNKNYSKYSLQVEKILVDYFVDIKDYLNAYHIYTLMLGEKNLPTDTKESLFHNYLLSLRELGKYEEAITFYQNNIHSYNEDIFKIMADIFYAKKDYDNCATTLQAIFNHTPKPNILKKIAVVYYEWKGPKEAWQVLEQNLDPNSPIELKELLARFYYEDNVFEKSYDVLSTINLESLSNYSFMLLFKIAVILNNKDGILLYKDQVARFNRLDKDFRNHALYKIGEIYYNNNDFKDASKYLGLWLDEFAQDDWYDAVLYMQAICDKELQKLDEAIVLLSKIHKLKKKDRIYYEAFLEKGEIYFILQEYAEAIANYNIYIKNKKFTERKQGALLQLANAEYNIKRYSVSTKLYQNYSNQYGQSKYIYKKIANSLVNANNYKGIISYFVNKKAIGDYPQYLILYSYYKLAEYKKLLNYSRLVNEKKSKYFIDVVYLKVLSFNQLKRNNEIINYYGAINHNIQKIKTNSKIIDIKKIFFTIFVKMARLDLSKSIFYKTKKTDLIFFKGEVYYRNLYLTKANDIFISLIDSGEYKKLTVQEKNIMIKSLSMKKKYEQSLIVINNLLENNNSNLNLLLNKIDVLFALKKIDLLKELQESTINQMLIKSIDIEIKLIENNEESKYSNNILSIVKNKDIELPTIQWLYLKLLRVYYNKKDYTTVLKFLDKIPKKTMTNISAEFTFLKASSILALGDEQKALAEFLKIYYIFHNDTFWVEKSIKKVLAIYRDNGDTKKYNQTKSLFEDKYFVLH